MGKNKKIKKLNGQICELVAAFATMELCRNDLYTFCQAEQDENKKLNAKYKDLQLKFANSFVSLDGNPVKRAMIGKRGCGKTHYIQNVIIPSLEMSRRDYFIVDFNNEYDEVPINKKFVFNNKSSKESQLKKLSKITFEKAGSNCVFILEDAGLVLFNSLTVSKFIQTDWYSKNINVLFVLQSVCQVGDICGFFDYIYKFKTCDSVERYDKRQATGTFRNDSGQLESKFIDLSDYKECLEVSALSTIAF